MTTAIWWIRRDLRLVDNPALRAAIDHADQVVPLFILDPTIQARTSRSEKRWAFLIGALRDLDQQLQVRGSYLLIRRGQPINILTSIQEEMDFTAIFAQEDSSPFGRRRDDQIAKVFPLTLTDGLTIRPLSDVHKKDGTPYTVFSPYKKMFLSLPLPRAADLCPVPAVINTPPDLPSESLASAEHPAPATYPPTAATTQQKLDLFLADGIHNYHEKRNFVSESGTSQLSAYLRFGLLSSRLAAVRALEVIALSTDKSARKGAETWLSELIWRDFYHSIQYYYPHVHRGSFRPIYDRIQWRNDQAEFEAWCAGLTGYPIVDAAMRQLTETGWMHNRARMIVASFLVKDLLVDWRWGERYFMEHLIDGDPAANNGGWQWTAGTGTDAAPYFRVFNPMSQSQKFDPDGVYIRRWVAELRPVNNRYIHAPWEMPPLEQRRIGLMIGRDYPVPIVDHKVARQRTLDAYKAAREN